MKFRKEFNSQMVQEWREAYMDYTHLKNLLSDFRQQNATPPRRLHRSFSSLTARSPTAKHEEAATPRGNQSHYECLIAKLWEEGAESEVAFFEKMDIELDKVREFYEGKVEAMKRNAEELSRQMDAFIAFRLKLTQSHSVGAANDDDDVVSTSSSPPPDGLNPGEDINVIEEVGEEAGDKKVMMNDSLRPTVLNDVKINIDPETPISTIKNVVTSWESEASFTKMELRKAEKKLRKAFILFHHQLLLLKSYSFMNMVAFSKIMKKYDKMTSRRASKTYLEIVEMSSVGSSDEVNKLIKKVEAAFIKHFADGDPSQGMKLLRPGDKKESHTISFTLGLLTGCSIALIAAVIVSVYARNLLEHEAGGQYMGNIFPLYSLFGYIVLHMVMYGANTYLWRRLRINYPFIMGFKPGSSLGFRQVFLLAAALSVLTLAAILAHLDLEMDDDTQKFRLLTELLPLALVTVVIFVAFCPFNIIYRSSRFFLIRSTWRCILAPFYKVGFVDFFLADQLTSQVQAIRSMQFYVCYYIWGDFRRRSNTKCLDSSTYDHLHVALALIPFWLRLLQCLRRLIEERNVKQGLNGLKYLSTVVALVMRSLYDIARQNGSQARVLRIAAASTSGITTIYTTYWDIVVDWGLLHTNSKNRWLRDKLLIPYKPVYIVAIVVNILLRLVWMQLVLDFNLPFLHRNAMVFVVACLEILRRGIWNFFRLENEHFNNVENYRAFKSIPLPFYYEEDKTL